MYNVVKWYIAIYKYTTHNLRRFRQVFKTPRMTSHCKPIGQPLPACIFIFEERVRRQPNQAIVRTLPRKLGSSPNQPEAAIPWSPLNSLWLMEAGWMLIHFFFHLCPCFYQSMSLHSCKSSIKKIYVTYFWVAGRIYTTKLLWPYRKRSHFPQLMNSFVQTLHSQTI